MHIKTKSIFFFSTKNEQNAFNTERMNTKKQVEIEGEIFAQLWPLLILR